MKQSVWFRMWFAVFVGCIITAGAAYDLEAMKVFLPAAGGVLFSASAMNKTYRGKE